MPNNPNKISRFWKELKRRRVIHLITVYASVSFIIIELTNNVIEPLKLPERLSAIVIISLAIGFPIAIILSWIFDVTPAGIEKTKSSKGQEAEKVVTPNSWRIATYVSIVIIVGLILFNVLGQGLATSDSSRYTNSIVVLPFLDLSPQKDQEYFCDGMSEEIINVLAQVEELKVIARTSSFAFKGKNEDVREIGKKLNVEALLEGSIRKEGNRLRITAQLIRVSDGSHIWANNYDRELESVFEIQDELALAIADNLKVSLLGENKTSIVNRYTENLEAYNLYLLGRYNFGLMTPEGLQNSLIYFEQAIEKDPDFAQAYADMALLYSALSYGLMPPKEAIPKAEAYANKALELDDKIARAYSLLGDINMNFHWNWEEAERMYKKAIEMNPNNASSYSILLSYLGRNKEALNMADQAFELDPLSGWIVFSLGWAYYHDKQYEKAIDVFESALAMDPTALMAQYYLGLTYRAKSKMEEAIETHEKLFHLSTNDVRTMAILTISYYEAGETVKADSLFESLSPRIEDEYVSPALLYLIYKSRGESELAYEWFKQAVSQRDGWVLWVIVDPFERERVPAEPRFQKLLNTIGLDKHL